MKTKYYLVTTIIVLLATIIVFFYLSIEARKLPFKSNPRYELTAYFQSRDLSYDSLFHIKGRLYATFNNKGYCKLIQKYNDKMIFNDLRLSASNIDQLNQYFKTAKIKQDLIHTGPPISYNGPMLRLDCFDNNISKELYFVALDDSVYNRIFNEIYSFTIRTKQNTFNHTIIIKEMRFKMLTSIRQEIESKFRRNTNFNWDILE